MHEIVPHVSWAGLQSTQAFQQRPRVCFTNIFWTLVKHGHDCIINYFCCVQPGVSFSELYQQFQNACHAAKLCICYKLPGLAHKLCFRGPAVSLKQLLCRRQLPVSIRPPETVLPQVCSTAVAEWLHMLIDVHEVGYLVPAGADSSCA